MNHHALAVAKCSFHSRNANVFDCYDSRNENQPCTCCIPAKSTIFTIAQRSGRLFPQVIVDSKARSEICLFVAAGNAYSTIHPSKMKKYAPDRAKTNARPSAPPASQNEYNTLYLHSSIRMTQKWSAPYPTHTTGTYPSLDSAAVAFAPYIATKQ